MDELTEDLKNERPVCLTLIDKIDTLLAEHYGFTNEELDFTSTNDIKYRIGKELEEED